MVFIVKVDFISMLVFTGWMDYFDQRLAVFKP